MVGLCERMEKLESQCEVQDAWRDSTKDEGYLYWWRMLLQKGTPVHVAGIFGVAGPLINGHAGCLDSRTG